MDRIIQPTKSQVRDWLLNRRINPGPLPDHKSICRDLGWIVVPKTGQPGVAIDSGFGVSAEIVTKNKTVLVKE